MAVQIQFRRDYSGNWSYYNPTLAQGELGIETDTMRLKIGDGYNSWNSLSYWSGSGSSYNFYSPLYCNGSDVYLQLNSPLFDNYGYLDINRTESIETNYYGALHLVGDNYSPSAYNFYGTDYWGNKGWYSIPYSGSYFVYDVGQSTSDAVVSVDFGMQSVGTASFVSSVSPYTNYAVTSIP